MITLSVKKLAPEVKLPVYATGGAARFDFFAFDIAEVRPRARTVIFRTGLAFEIPFEKEMVIMGRSGLGFKHNIRLANCEGVIDSDYRDEVMIALTADSDEGFAQLVALRPGDRIAQGKIQDAERAGFREVTALSQTSRTGGFGSSGLRDAAPQSPEPVPQPLVGFPFYGMGDTVTGSDPGRAAGDCTATFSHQPAAPDYSPASDASAVSSSDAGSCTPSD